MEKVRKNKKRKWTKRKTIVLIALIAIIIAIIIGIFFFINLFIPVKDISKSNISINLSTMKPTGESITAKVSTKTHYDIYYFIDYAFAEEKYYESEDLSEEVSNESSNSDSTDNNDSENTINVKQISDSEYKKVVNSTFEIENNGVVYLKYGRFGKLSSTPYVFEITNIDKTGPDIGEIETTSTYTSITVKVNASDATNSELQYAFRLSTENTFIQTGTTNTYTFTELTTNETYTIIVRVTDKYGNEAEAITEAIASIEDKESEFVEKKLYHFKVNNATNTVTVYEKGEDNKFSKPVKAFICSTGKATPKSGTYKISDRYRWRSLFGNVYGQYAVRICGNILFHSVPYEQMYANTLEYEEYDKLGTSASMGCVRLCVKDAKWIYDNAQTGSTVEFYSDSSNPGPLGKPSAQKISDNKANRNWDPTDPDKHNPWLGGDGAVSKVTIINDDTSSSTTKNTSSKEETTNTTTVPSENTIVWNTTD